MRHFHAACLLTALCALTVGCENADGGAAADASLNDTSGQELGAPEDADTTTADVQADTVGQDVPGGTDTVEDQTTGTDTIGPVDTTDPIDAGIPYGKCTAEVDCTGNGEFCLAPGAFGGCGICMKPDDVCATDAECQAVDPTYVCIWRSDSCVCGGETTCQPGCQANSDCKTGQTCNDKLRCVPTACEANDGCPAQFACVTGACERRICTASSDCGSGYCVNGACHGEPGTCEMAKP